MDKIQQSLNKRNEERKLNNDILYNVKSKQAAVEENIDNFDKYFEEKSDAIGNLIDKLDSNTSFYEASQNLQDLQKYLSSSTFYLNDRKVQRCQQIINELSKQLENQKIKFIPKKKFGFKHRLNVTQPKETENVDKVDCNKSSQYDTPYTLSNCENVNISYKKDECESKDLSFFNIKNCTITIEGCPGALHLKQIENCKVFSSSVSREVFGEHCHQSLFAITCQQLRLHNSTDCDIYLYVTSAGIIEDSSRIRVAPLTSETCKKLNIKTENNNQIKNNWNRISDFNWLNKDEHSPNWTVIPENERHSDWENFIGKITL